MMKQFLKNPFMAGALSGGVIALAIVALWAGIFREHKGDNSPQHPVLANDMASGVSGSSAGGTSAAEEMPSARMSDLPRQTNESMDAVDELAALDSWISMGHAGIEELQSILEDSRNPEQERLRAARALAAIGSYEALQALFEGISSEEDAEMRELLVTALDAFGEVETVDSLASLLVNSEDPVVHSAVIDTLSRMAQPSTVEYLAELHSTQVSTPESGSPLLVALSAIRNHESIPSLAAILSDVDASNDLRAASATSLAKIGEKESLSHLAGAESSKNPPNSFGIQALAGIQDPAAVPSLKSLLEISENTEVSAAISQSLQTIEAVHSALKD